MYRSVCHLLIICLTLGDVACRARHASTQRSSASQISRAAPAAVPVASPAFLSWNHPSVAPCALFDKAEIESLLGTLREEPRPGGSTLDGASCVYVGAEPLVVSIGVISTAVFEAEKSDPDITYIDQFADQAYIVRPNSFDTNFLARRGEHAVMIKLTAAANITEDVRLHIVEQLGEEALGRLAKL